MAILGFIMMLFTGLYLLFNGVCFLLASGLFHSGWAGTLLVVIGGGLIYLAGINAPFTISMLH